MMPQLPHWSCRPPPTLEEFEKLAAQCWGSRPEPIRDQCRDVLIRIDDLPSTDILNAMGIESPLGLLGLYQGVSLNHKSVHDLHCEPDIVFLYRRPILAYWADGDETLSEIVSHVLIHELGHHFGFSDDDMKRLEDVSWLEQTGNSGRV